MSNKVTTAVRLPVGWIEELSKRARENERSVSAEIRLALRQYLGEQTERAGIKR
ncbi:MAG TPA: Arc family DNA-binding protein [Candidatus Fraserbacteria bacterium]|nr:Arc family DNA-binding protein [Candidatus Fraserbacteria bacterium]